ncbi:hypothetical protein [Macrococcoides canis]|uniref:hypothetical protein n=1 Tax=Macrococcoides canis TaxID=1855823 RepID=UPI001060D539|nr:hypothetical protein [Macrococcus canis]TDM33029.1 hypothetical protein ETI13_09025 [Macrococcus canis]
MDRITKIMMIFLLFITLTPLSAQATVTACEKTIFKVTSPQTGDDKLIGTALGDKKMNIRVNDKAYPLIVKPNGQFELTLEEPLSKGEKVVLEQGINKLEVTVEDKPDQLETSLEKPFECMGLVEVQPNSSEEPTTKEKSGETTIEESTKESPTTEEPTTKEKSGETTIEESTKESPTTEEPSIEEKSGETTIEEGTKESPTTEEISIEEISEENTLEEGTKELPTTERPSTEETTLESATIEKPTTETPTIEQPVPKSIVFKSRAINQSLATSMFSLLTQNTSINETANFLSCPTNEKYNSSISVNMEGPFRQKVQGNIVCVKTAAEFNAQIINADTEVIIFLADIDDVAPNVTMKSNYGQKVIDANGYSLSVANSGYLLINRSSNITNLVVKDASNLYSGNSLDKNGMFTVDYIGIDVNIVNSTFNKDNKSTGHLGASWESALHFYGNNIINSNHSYATFYRFINVHDNATLTLNSSQNGFNFITNSRESAVAPNTGLKINNNASVSINAIKTAGSINQNNKPFELSVGSGSKLNVVSNKGFDIQASTPAQITFDSGSVVQMSTTSDAFHLNSSTVTMDINSGANVRLNSIDSVISSPRSSTSHTFNIAADADFVTERTGTTNLPIWNVENPLVFNINSAANVDFKNSKGRLFTTASNRTHTFNIQNVAIRSWLTDSNKALSDYQTSFISSGKFSLGPSETIPISNMSNNFAAQFPPTMNRIQFLPSIKTPVPQPVIDDTTTTITGTATPGILVTIKNTGLPSNNILTPTADSTGKFTVTVPTNWLKKGDVLEFSASHNGLSSDVATRTVTGNTLQLLQPQDVIFESTSIEDIPDKLIHRTTPSEYSVKVKDTRSSGNWNLSVQVSKKLTNPKGSVIDNGLVYRSNGQETILKTGTALKVAEKNTLPVSSSGIYEKTWSNEDGILLRTNPVKVAPGTYSGTLTWTLSSGP